MSVRAIFDFFNDLLGFYYYARGMIKLIRFIAFIVGVIILISVYSRPEFREAIMMAIETELEDYESDYDDSDYDYDDNDSGYAYDDYDSDYGDP